MSSNPALRVKDMSVSFQNQFSQFFSICLRVLRTCIHTIHFCRQNLKSLQVPKKLDLTDTIKDGARLFFTDEGIRRQLLLALTEDSKLHIQEVCEPEYYLFHPVAMCYLQMR